MSANSSQARLSDATPVHDAPRSAAEIEGAVERTRSDVAGTLDALRDKLLPSQMIDEVVDRAVTYAKGSGGAAFARNLGTAVRDNPLPVVLIGAGIAWLLLARGGEGAASPDAGRTPPWQDRPDAGRDGGRSRAASMAGGVGDAATRAGALVADKATRAVSAVSSLGDTLAGVVGSAQDMAGSLGERAVETAGALRAGAGVAGAQVSAAASRAAERWEEVAEAQPLLLGVLGLAVGAAIGAALPRTPLEDRLLGESRDAVANSIADAASGAIGEVRQVVTDRVGEARETLGETYDRARQRIEGSGLAEAGKAAGEGVVGAVETVKDAILGAADDLQDRARPHDPAAARQDPPPREA